MARGMSSAVKFDLFNPTEEHRQLREMIRSFAEKEVDPQAQEWNRREEFNMDLFRKLGELGVLGITVSEEYGGAGGDAVATCIVHEELSAADPAFTLSYLAHSMLFVNNLFRNGNDEQRRRFLPDTCSGKRIGGMGMSEPGAGTDVLGLASTARKQGDRYVLNGSKMWITNGAVSDTELGDVFLVYARTGKEAKDVSLFLVEKGMPGFRLGQRIKDKCGMRASCTAELVFEDLEVPAENLVGQEHGAVLCMMRNLELERLALAAMSQVRTHARARAVARRARADHHRPAALPAGHRAPLRGGDEPLRAAAEGLWSAAQPLRADPAPHRRVVRRDHGRQGVHVPGAAARPVRPAAAADHAR